MKTHMRASLIISSIGLCVVLGLLVGHRLAATDEAPASPRRRISGGLSNWWMMPAFVFRRTV